MPTLLYRWLRRQPTRVGRLVVCAAIYLVVVGLPAAGCVVAAGRLRDALGPSWWWGTTGVLAVLAIVAPIVCLRVLRRFEDRLARDQRRYHRTLISASSGMTRIKELQRLCDLIVHMVNRTVGLTHSALLLYEPKEQRYTLRAVRHKAMMPGRLVVAERDPLIQLLQESRDLVLIEELHRHIEASEAGERTQQVAWVYSWMRRHEVRLIVPSFSDDRLLAFLILGAKRSGEGYTTDDIALFSGLANQAALGIENALFFEELRNSEAYMIQSEKLASIGQLASGMAHEIHNPLTIISGEAQLYLERCKGKDAEVDGVLRSIIEEVQRAADITRRILRFARPAPTELGAVDVKTVVEETIALAGYQVRLERVQRTITLPDQLPKVRGNHNQLQEVILNLLLNAYQAMGEAGGRLTIAGRIVDAEFVELTVADSGPGIAPEKLSKVFDPFFTTKATGTGLGLFVSQRIIRAHGGTLDVTSTAGQGACFTIRLPVWREPVNGASGHTTERSIAAPTASVAR